MRAEYINPFILSTSNVYSTMLSCELERGTPALKESFCPEYEVSGVIGLTGNAVGTVVVSLSRNAALNSAAKLLEEDPKSLTDIDRDVVDAIGELTNMIAGGAKAKLEELSLSVSLPSVICGKNHTVSFPSEATPISIPFDSKWGPISIEVGLVAV